MIISITGATGFVGKKLVQQCVSAGHTVRVLSRREPRQAALPESVRWFQGGLDDITQLRRFAENSDILYHCAAEIRNPSGMMRTNRDGTRNLIAVSRGLVDRWVQLSSVGVYGLVRDGGVSEESPEKPTGIYEMSKAQADDLVRAAAEERAFDAVLLRPSIVYSPEMTNRSVFQLIRTIDQGYFFFVGPKGASANYVHVDDVVGALVQCGINPGAANRTYNLSVGDTLEVLVEAIAGALGRPAPALRLPRGITRALAATMGWMPNFPLTVSRVDALSSRSHYPIDRIQRELGFVPRVSLPQGMAEMARFWKARR